MTVSFVLSNLIQIPHVFIALDDSVRIKMISINTLGDLSSTVVNNMVYKLLQSF